MRTTAVFSVMLISGIAYGADCSEEVYTTLRSAEGEYEQGDYAGAERLFRSGIGALTKCVPADDPTLLIARNNLGATLLHIGRFREAERELTVLVPLIERRREASLELANTLNNLGEAYFGLGQLKASSKIHERALTIRENMTPANDEHVAMSAENLGRALYGLGQRTRARTLLQRALLIWEKAPRGRSSDLMTTLLTLAALEGDENKHDLAEALQNRAVVVATEDFGVNHEAYAAVLVHLAIYYLNTKQIERADRTCRDAMTALEAVTAGVHDHRHAFLLDTHASILERLIGGGREAAGLRKRAEAVRALRP